MYERCGGMGPSVHRVKCGVVEWMKRNTVRWFGRMERTMSEEFVRKVYVTKTECPGKRLSSVVKEKD